MKYSADAILNFTSYRDLFSDDAEQAKKQRRTLLGAWHPDINSDPQAEEVFTHIGMLFSQPHRTQHRVFSCIDQLKQGGPFKAWICGKLESFPSFEHFHTAYYGNHDIGSSIQFRSAIN